jgi:hypothetical protein
LRFYIFFLQSIQESLQVIAKLEVYHKFFLFLKCFEQELIISQVFETNKSVLRSIGPHFTSQLSFSSNNSLCLHESGPETVQAADTSNADVAIISPRKLSDFAADDSIKTKTMLKPNNEPEIYRIAEDCSEISELDHRSSVSSSSNISLLPNDPGTEIGIKAVNSPIACVAPDVSPSKLFYFTADGSMESKKDVKPCQTPSGIYNIKMQETLIIPTKEWSMMLSGPNELDTAYYQIVLTKLINNTTSINCVLNVRQ